MNYENIVEDKKTEIKVLKEKEIFLKKYGTGEPNSAKKGDENTTVVYNAEGFPLVKTFLKEYDSKHGDNPSIHHALNSFQGFSEGQGWYMNIEAHDYTFSDGTSESVYTGDAINRDGEPLNVHYEYPPVDPTTNFYTMLKQAQESGKYEDLTGTQSPEE